MNTLFFTHQHRRSTKTLRLHYGLEGMKYIIQVYEGEINGHGEKEGLPTEYQYEFEQEMLKHVHDLKNEIREKGWWERDTPKVSKPPSYEVMNPMVNLGSSLSKESTSSNTPPHIKIDGLIRVFFRRYRLMKFMTFSLYEYSKEKQTKLLVQEYQKR